MNQQPEIILELIDIERYLNDRGIDCKTSGHTDIGSGWIGITCVFPFCSDDMHHLGINLNSKFFSCWKCGEKGSAIKLIHEIEACSWHKAKEIALSYQDKLSSLKPSGTYTHTEPGHCNIPSFATKTITKGAGDYLYSRGFDPAKLYQKYNLHSCLTYGDYSYRIMAPVFLYRKMVSFMSMGYHNLVKPHYLACPIKKSVLPINSTIYNIDNIHGTRAILVEGITDVWRFGDNVGGMYGKLVTHEQVSLLLEKGIREVFLMPDPDAMNEAKTNAFNLSTVMDTAEILEIADGDPAEFTQQEAERIKNMIGL